MKKFLVFALSMACMTVVEAQPNTLLLAGGLEGLSAKRGNAKESYFIFTPALGYQWDKNWTAGLTFDFETGKSVNLNGVQTQKNTGFGLGPFLRYSCPISDVFSTFFQLDASFLDKKFDGVNGKEKRFTTNFAPYVQLHVKKGFSMYFSFGGLGFTSTKPAGGGIKEDAFNFNFGRTALLGVQKNFDFSKSK